MCKNGEYVSPVGKKSWNFKHLLITLFRSFFSKERRFQAKNILHLKLSSYRNISILQKHKDLNTNWRKHGKIWRKWAPNSKVIYACDNKILRISKNSYFCKQEIYKNDHTTDIHVNIEVLTSGLMITSGTKRPPGVASTQWCI